ncbi:MAG: nucleotidyltransferase domain-containing protein [Elusimicrobia bacterium]|nr:nucleotidyltransferase domain-containing protein [Elusimicrobiota bacterium]
MADHPAFLDSAFAQRVIRILKSHPVGFAYVFGSLAAGSAGPSSDLDLAAFFDRRLTSQRRNRLRLRLLRELAETGGAPNGLDLVVLNDCGLNLAYDVIHGGRLLFCKEPLRRIRFEAGACLRYFDRLYYIRRSAEQVLRRTAARGVLERW